jgi:imidazolonepropionase-like amidohydrolase
MQNVPRDIGNTKMTLTHSTLVFGATLGMMVAAAGAQVAVKAATLHTMGPAGTIKDAIVVVRDGKISAVGPAASTQIPQGYRLIEAAIVTPGLIDAHATVGLTGIYNTRHDSDQIERSSPIQPELRAIDAFNPQEKLIEWVRSYGITTVHTGHAPGELISGQSGIFKLKGNTSDAAAIVPAFAVMATLDTSSIKSGGSPGTRAKQVAMLREELIRAREFLAKGEHAAEDNIDKGDVKKDDHDAGKKSHAGDRRLRTESLAKVLKGELVLVITADRAQDIANALRLQQEFGFKLMLDSCAEATQMKDEIKKSGVPVIVHPLMSRYNASKENASMETPMMLRDAGITFAMQSGYEDYVPKVRVLLFEAAVAAANGLTFDQTLASITTTPARLLGIDKRVGSIEIGKDGDLALYDGDPFEYTSHCIGTIIDGVVMHDKKQ